MEQVQDRPNWVLGLHIERPELRARLAGVVQTANRGLPIYVYAANGPRPTDPGRSRTVPQRDPDRHQPGRTRRHPHRVPQLPEGKLRKGHRHAVHPPQQHWPGHLVVRDGQPGPRRRRLPHPRMGCPRRHRPRHHRQPVPRPPGHLA
ncbi:putative antirestriction adenine methyltransferase [Streptomyces sp. EKR5.2]|uniref:putative antirestriction adenine methyltransferase n=1 Tax=Streptomyces sp. EKR5.2 TaxID=3461014 RepID=UPI004042E452